MIAAVCAVMSVICLANVFPQRRRSLLPIELARLSTMDTAEVTALRQMQTPTWERLFQAFVIRIAPKLQPQWAGVSNEDLRRAGIDPHRFGVIELLVAKVLGAGALAAMVIVLSTVVPAAFILLPAAAFMGFVTPSIVVHRRQRARQRQMLNELPDVLGLLRAFVGAGISLEQALHLISAQLTRGSKANLLANEIRTALGDYGLGASIDDALHTMGQRTGLSEVDMVVSALVQGKRQGAGMDRILRDQESVIRLQQRTRVAASASHVGTKLVGILALVYLPEFMLLIMGPLFYGIFLRTFG